MYSCLRRQIFLGCFAARWLPLSQLADALGCGFSHFKPWPLFLFFPFRPPMPAVLLQVVRPSVAAYLRRRSDPCLLCGGVRGVSILFSFNREWGSDPLSLWFRDWTSRNRNLSMWYRLAFGGGSLTVSDSMGGKWLAKLLTALNSTNCKQLPNLLGYQAPQKKVKCITRDENRRVIWSLGS